MIDHVYNNILYYILDYVADEVKRSNTMFPNKFNSTHEAYGVIKEEFDEFWDEIKNDDLEKMHIENVQLAAMCIKSLLSYENYKRQIERRRGHITKAVD
jgi:hypothetical protein